MDGLVDLFATLRTGQLYEKYPQVLDLFVMEKLAELSEKESAVFIKVVELKNKLTDMEMQSVYFRGCYDSGGHMKKGRNFIRS